MAVMTSDNVPPVVEAVESGRNLAGAKRAWLIGLAVLAAAALVIWFLGLSAFPLVIVVAVALALVLTQFSSPLVGISGALLLLLGSYAVWIRLVYYFPVGLPVSGAVTLIAALVICLLLLARMADPWLPSRGATIAGAVVLGLALLATVVFIPWRSAQGAAPIWAMHNDATIQVMKAFPQIDDGGLNTAFRPNSSPLTSALLAMAAAVGRLRVANLDQLFENDILRAAEYWGLMIFTTMLLAGLIAWRATARPQADSTGFAVAPANRGRTSRLIFRILAIACVTLLPLTWYFAGLALTFGFYNSTLALIILLAAWAIWREGPEAPPLLTAFLLGMGGVAMLATWAPIALIPAALAILTLYRALRLTLVAQNRRSWLLLIGAALPIPLYGLFITVFDFMREGEALGAYGGIPAISLNHVFLVVLVTSLVVILRAIGNGVWWNVLGTGLVIFSGLSAVAFLAFLNLRSGVSLWGYYPIKAAWTVTSLVIIIGLTEALGWVLDRPYRYPESATEATAGPALYQNPGLSFAGSDSMMANPVLLDERPIFNSPALSIEDFPFEGQESAGEQQRIQSSSLSPTTQPARGSAWVTGLSLALTASLAFGFMLQYQYAPINLSNFFTPLEILRSTGPALGPERANVVFDVYRNEQATIVARFENQWNVIDRITPGDGRTDRFANLWLLQVLSTDGADPIRPFAYFLNTYDAGEICAAVATWEQPVIVVTDDWELPYQLEAQCPLADLTVDLRLP
ncbi:MAG: hypothetical protein FWG25_08155 [Promicromonosporaceae bacterium]|nr:hypothetical protein [Promicromonosporaceae bacterium]